MNQQQTSRRQTNTANSSVPSSEAITPEERLLQKVENLLEQGQPKQALDAIRHANLSSQQLTNAKVVCQLRLGQAKSVIEMLRPILLADGVHLRPEAPLKLKVNFAMALLLDGNVPGCIQVLREIEPQDDPAVLQVHEAVAAWKRQLSLFQRINWFLGGDLNVPVKLDHPPGVL